MSVATARIKAGSGTAPAAGKNVSYLSRPGHATPTSTFFAFCASGPSGAPAAETP